MSLVVITYCMVLNPYICRWLEAGEMMTTECIKAGAIQSMTFELEHAEWKTKGWHCVDPVNPHIPKGE